METEIDRIIDELNREYEGEPWHGSPLTHILEGITAQQAATQPIVGAHSIFELVLHMIGWKNEVRRRLSGAPAGEPEEGDWPAVSDGSPAGWNAAIQRLRDSHDALLADIRAFPEAKLAAPTNDPRETTGAGVSHYVLLHGIVQHDVYHAGQIAILKKAFSA